MLHQCKAALVAWGNRSDGIPASVTLHVSGRSREFDATAHDYEDGSFTLLFKRQLVLGQLIGIKIRFPQDGMVRETAPDSENSGETSIKALAEVIGEERRLSLDAEYRYTVRFYRTVSLGSHTGGSGLSSC